MQFAAIMSNANPFSDNIEQVSFIVEGASSSPVRTREQYAPATIMQSPHITSKKVVQASRLQSPGGQQSSAAAAPSPTTRVHINATQYFGGIPPCVWTFRVGGYQVCEKWLKDRKGRPLDYADLQHYQRIVVALHATIRLMVTIDQTIASYGGWPMAFGGASDWAQFCPEPTRERRTPALLRGDQ